MDRVKGARGCAWGAVLALGLLAPSLAMAQDGLLIRQVYLERDTPGFIELVNTTDAVMTLQGVHLATTPDFGLLPSADGPALVDGQVIVKLPDGLQVPPGEVAVQLSAGSFVEAYGFAPELSLPTSDEGAQAVEVVAGDPEGGALASFGGGVVALFVWDGQSDLVQDLDVVIWGEGVNVDRSGVAVDGPDDGDEASIYADDTAPGDQRPADAIEPGNALLRGAGEVDEATEGGNGIGGHDETSEDMASAFSQGAPAPVAAVPVVGSVVSPRQGLDVEGLTLRFEVDGDTREVVTDAQGGFLLELPASSAVPVTVLRNDVVLKVTSLVVGQGATDGAVISLDAFGISGIVAPAHDGIIDLGALFVTVAGTEVAQPVGDDGAFALSVDEPGRYTLVVEGPGIRPARADVEVVDADITGLVITVLEAHTLGGVVSSAQGPLAGATVSIPALGTTDTTGDDGAYRFEALPVGTLEVHFSAPGFVAQALPVDLSQDTTLNVTLEALPRHGLTISVKGEGAAAAGATVRATLVGGSDGVEAVADANGQVSFGALVVGNYIVEVSAEGHTPLRIEAVPLTHETALVVQLVPLSRQPEVTTVSCAQVSPSGAPMGGAALWALGLALVMMGRSRRRQR